MLNESFLKEDFQVIGNDLNECKELISEMTDHTKFEKINSAALGILSYVPVETSRKVNFYQLNPDNLPTDNPNLTLNHFRAGVSKEAILKRGDFQFLIDETENISKLAFLNNNRMANNLYFASPNAFASMEGFGLKGSFLSTPSVERDLIIAKQFKREKNITLVSRNITTTVGAKKVSTKKIFAIHSERYTEVSQMEIFNLIDKIISEEIFGKVRCSRWVVNHFITLIELEFPEKAKEICESYGLPNNFIPGIRITTSDTGNSSFRITGTWRIHNSLTLTNEVAKRHSGEINISEIIDDVDKEIFADYVKIPEALCDLMMKNVTPSDIDLSLASDQKKNKDIIKSTIKATFSELGLVKAIGKKTEAVIKKLMLDEIDASMSYTAYDIAMQILTLPERLEGLSKNTADALAKAIAKAPFCKYNPMSNAEEDLYLI